MKRYALAGSLSALFLTQTAFGAAFQLYELGTPIIGTADVGQAAVANDASVAYFNPAAMTQLKSSQFMLGSQLVLPYTNFSKNNGTTFFGDNGGNAGTLTPGVDLFYVYSYSSQLKLGVSLTTPYAGMLNYNDGWVGRYVVQDMQFYTLNVNPAMAYQFNNWLALGAGFSVEYANLSQTVAIPILPLIDGQANLKLDNTSAGVNVGVLLTPYSTTKIGIAYRSQITHSLTGNTDFLRLSATPSTTSRMVMPQNVIASLSQQLTDQFDLLAEMGWSNWATMRNTTVNIADFSVTTPEDWSNTYRVGLAGQYRLKPEFLIHAGASYDSSPTSTSRRLPVLPMDRQVRVGAGVAYAMTKFSQLGFSYEYIDFGNAKINSTLSNGTLSGSYSRNYANVFQASVNVSC